MKFCEILKKNIKKWGKMSQGKLSRGDLSEDQCKLLTSQLFQNVCNKMWQTQKNPI